MSSEIHPGVVLIISSIIVDRPDFDNPDLLHLPLGEVVE
jgi:hypothetical protein